MTRVVLAYLCVIIVWSTTPLTVKWSGEEIGFLIGVMARMMLAASVSLFLIAAWQKSLPPWTPQARRVYIAVGVPLYTSMLCTYFGAQFISSGLIAILFGLTPVLSGLIAAYWIKENNFSAQRIIGMILGVAGLIVIFYHRVQFGPQAHWGILAVLAGVLLQSIGMVWIKRVQRDFPIGHATTGGLFVASALYLSTWILFDRHLPDFAPTRTVWSIVYLGIVGSVVVGFAYFYLLRHLDTGRVSMITVITPVAAVMVGHFFNSEPISPSTIIGALFVLSGIVFYLLPSLFRNSLLDR